MKNYRMCEANRKVFLYPENWIEAELRDERKGQKTPPIKVLSSPNEEE
ncbi:MAG: neuraminidase-like domain-containing protein [Candidatus Scalindua sp.]